jgi:dephospho-CoA kinase
MAQAWRIGLTGGIGSGKSTVASCLAALGAEVIDTDAIARRLSAPGGAAIEPLRRAFGDALIDASGALDRARMRALAFSDPGVKQRLESILHPLIGEETSRQAAASARATIVFDVPLLVESGRWRPEVDRVWVVDCRTTTQIERVVRRSGWTPQAVQAVISQQATRAQRRACADLVVCNEGLELAELQQLVTGCWQRHGR